MNKAYFKNYDSSPQYTIMTTKETASTAYTVPMSLAFQQSNINSYCGEAYQNVEYPGILKIRVTDIPIPVHAAAMPCWVTKGFTPITGRPIRCFWTAGVANNMDFYIDGFQECSNSDIKLEWAQKITDMTFETAADTIATLMTLYKHRDNTDFAHDTPPTKHYVQSIANGVSDKA